jgi:hypothetical protein
MIIPVMILINNFIFLRASRPLFEKWPFYYHAFRKYVISGAAGNEYGV